MTIESDSTNVIIKGQHTTTSNWGWNNSLRVKFTITVPHKYNIDVDTSGGSININDLTGDVLAQTSGGSIKIQCGYLWWQYQNR